MTSHEVDGVCESVPRTFRFHRYHAELLRRKNQKPSSDQGGNGFNDICPVNDDLLLVNPQTAATISNSIPEGHNTINKDISKNGIHNASGLHASSLIGTTNTLENLINCTIVVDENGNINPVGSPNKSQQFPMQVDLQTTLLLRNIQNSRIEIQNSLAGLHIVNVHHTQILVQRFVESAIHVTKAIDTDLVILYPARQLRIHQAIRLHVTLGDHVCGEDQEKGSAQSTAAVAPTTPVHRFGWNPGSIILEHSKHVAFYVPTGTIQDGSSSPPFAEGMWMSIIKDFGWLRTSAPSPNFCIQNISSVVSQQTNQQLQPVQGAESDCQSINYSVSPSNIKVLPTTSRDNNDSDDNDDDDEL